MLLTDGDIAIRASARRKFFERIAAHSACDDFSEYSVIDSETDSAGSTVDETVAVEAHDDVKLRNLGNFEQRKGQELAHGFVPRRKPFHIRSVAAKRIRIPDAVVSTRVSMLSDLHLKR
jgi:hypothetical protein